VSDLQRVAEALRVAGAVAVLSHESPEADAIGASLGAALAMEAAGKQVGVYNVGPLPAALRGLPGVERVQSVLDCSYPCYLVLDTTEPARTGGLLERRPAGSQLLNVDHHLDNRGFGDLNWVDPVASSAGEMVYRLLLAAGFPLSPPVATNLYAAVLTDTGGFRHANTTPDALRIGAELVAGGAAPGEIARSLYGQRDPRELHLLGLALAELGVSPDGRLAWITVSRTAQAAAGVGLEAAEDFVQYPRAVAGVVIAVAFKEAAAEEVRVSLRSWGAVDVAALARRFGGGGHRNAAGCTLGLPLAAARATLLEAAAVLARA